MDIFPIRRPPDEPAETLVPDLSDGAEAGLYLALFELVEEGLIITSDETILEVNSAACQLLERTYPQLVGQPLAELFPTEAAFLAARAALFVNGASRGSLTLRMPDGQRRHLRCLSAARVRPGVHALVLSPDTAGTTLLPVTPIRRDDVWPRLAAAVRQPVLVVEGDGRIQAANAAAQAHLGRPGGSLVGANIAALGLDPSDTRRLPGPHPGWELLILPGGERGTPALVRRDDDRSQRLFRELPLAALLCAADTLQVLDANDAALKCYGRTHAELTRRTLAEMADGGDGKPDLHTGGRRRLRRGDDSSFEATLIVQRLSGVGRDELLVVHAPFAPPSPLEPFAAELFVLGNDGVMILDPAMRIRALNPALAKLAGVGRDALLGREAGLLIGSAGDDPFDVAAASESGRWCGEVTIRCADECERAAELQIARVGRDAAAPHYLATLRDLSERNALKDALDAARAEAQAPGLRARRTLDDQFRAVAAAVRRERGKLGVLVVDLTDFHRINAQLGNDAADQVLECIAQRIAGASPPQAVTARIGADSFVILAGDVGDGMDARTLAGRLLDAIAIPLPGPGAGLSLGAAVGIALQPEHGEGLGELLAHAETALAEARRGGPPLRVFDPEDADRALARSSLDAALRRAPSNGELRLHWQARYDLAQSRLVGAEALLRWKHPQLGLLDAERFVPAAIRSGGIVGLGAWALGRACEQMAAWREAFACELLVAINVCAEEVGDPQFAERVQRILEEHALPAAALELELSDCAGLHRDATAMANLKRLREAGVRLRVDHFGAEGAPLSVLRHLPVSGLKIDAQFVRDLTLSDEGPVLMEAILAPARGLGLDVVASGVEHAEQRDRLLQLGCGAGQGRLHGLPVSSESFGQTLAAAYGPR